MVDFNLAGSLLALYFLNRNANFRIRTPNDGIQPQAVVDHDGTLHLIYLKGSPDAGDIYYVRRSPGEGSFSKPIQVNSQHKSAMASCPMSSASLAAGTHGVLAAWETAGQVYLATAFAKQDGTFVIVY